MSNLILSNQSGLEVSKTRIIKFENGAITEKYPVLLLDVSGSMNREVGNRRKIDILRDAVTKVGAGMDIYSFSSSVVHSRFIPDPQGQTNLTKAFQELKGRSMQLLLISDGVADDPDEAILAGIALHCPVNVLYIGEPWDVGEEFMRRLAEATGGKWTTLDTMQPDGFGDRLEAGIEKLMLTA